MSESIRKECAFVLASMLVGFGPVYAEPLQAVLDVPGMNCSLCPITVKKALQRVPGYLDAQVDLSTKRAVVRYESDKATPERLIKAVADAGYPATLIKQ